MLALAISTPVHAESRQAINRVPDFEITQGYFQLNDDYGGDVAAYARAFELLASGGEEALEIGSRAVLLRMYHGVRTPRLAPCPMLLWFPCAHYHNKQTLEVMGGVRPWQPNNVGYYPDEVKQRLGGRLPLSRLY